MNVGQEYLVSPVPMKGKDGKMYNVFTFFASGRAWASNQYYIRRDNSNKPIRVKVLPRKADVVAAPSHAFVELIDSQEDQVRIFNKRPYVRKDGSFEVIKDEPECMDRFGHIYAVTKTRDYLWEEKDGKLSWMDQFYPELVAIFERGSMHYLTQMVIAAGTAVEV